MSEEDEDRMAGNPDAEPVDDVADASDVDHEDVEPVDDVPVGTPANPQGIYGDHLKPQPIEHELKTSYLDYSMSVIVGRAIPDVRDGLKPVHRRILYAMKELGVTASSAYKKSARTVGEVLGKFHPHGDTAVYDAMVRMAQVFSLRYPLVDGQGNFGSVDGDGAAAMRYTEARLSRITGELLEDIEKDTVDWKDNFDGTLQEPSVLPGKLPNLLLNGSDGIAVGMATKIPPHNLTEVCDAIVKMIDEPDVSIADLMEFVKGPDFPTGGIICGVGGIYSAYMTGRGRVVTRARVEVEDRGNDKDAIIITELPYQVNKANLLISIANLVKDKRIEGIADLRDESDRHGMRVVIELKRGVVTDLVLNQLYAHTQMQTTFGVLNLVLHKGQPKVMNLAETLNAYLEHREEVVRRSTAFDLTKAEEKLHLIEGLLIALDNIEEVIKIIRGSRDAELARAALMENFGLSELQAKAILDMRLAKLTGLEVETLKKDHDETKAFIERCKEILADRAERMKIIRAQVIELREKYGDARRSEISELETDVVDEDLIPREDVIVTVTRDGYIKRMSLDTYRAQHRGGKGLRGMKTKEEDEIQDLFVVHSHDWVMYFTDKGKVYWLKGYRIPEGSRQSKGKAIVNLLEGLEGDEHVLAAIPTSDFPEDKYVVFATKNGTVKRTSLAAYKNVRTTGIKAIVLEEDDSLVNVRFTDGDKLILMATRHGQACLFRESDVRNMGRVSRGVRGIKLGKGDEVASMAVFDSERFLEFKQANGANGTAEGGEPEAEQDLDEAAPGDDGADADAESDADDGAGMDPSHGPYVLVLTERGYGKATPLTEYRLTHRGGKGVKNVAVTKKNGPVIAIRSVYGDEDLLLTTSGGMVVRIRVAQVKVTKSRATQGVIIMRPPEDDVVQAVALLPSGDDEPEEGPQQAAPGADEGPGAPLTATTGSSGAAADAPAEGDAASD